jgi:hypothetical protein
VELIIHVSRGQDNRLTGSLRAAQDADVREFSGTLELTRVLEELVRSSLQPPATHIGPSGSTTTAHRSGGTDGPRGSH